MYKLNYNDALAENLYMCVKKRIQNLAKDFINGKTKKLDKVKYTALDNTKQYLREKILDDAYLEKLIAGRPDVLREIIKNIPIDAFNAPPAVNTSKYTKTQLERYHKELNDNYNLNRILYYIFYQMTYNDDKYLGKKQFIEGLKIRTCPYCNRNYIFVVKKENNGKVVKPEIDHFYPKSKYPFLAVSFYNLIPSCGMCNGFDCKSNECPCTDDKDPDNSQRIANPYEFEDRNYRFSFDYHNHELFNLTVDDIVLKIEGDNQLIQGYEDFFAIKALYSEHREYIVDIIIKLMYQYNSSGCYYLKKNLGSNINESVLSRAFWGFSIGTDDSQLRIFNKFFNDILKKAKEYQSPDDLNI